MHELNILLVKFYFNNFDNGIFLFSPYGIMLIFTWFYLERCYCGAFLEKVYLYNENEHDISFKITYKRIY